MKTIRIEVNKADFEHFFHKFDQFYQISMKIFYLMI